MITYPKIETLFDRNLNTFKVNPDVLRRPEFGLIRRWRLTEKIDGMNIRIGLSAADSFLTFAGRTDAAQLPLHLLEYLTATFPFKRVSAAFPTGSEVVLFGEGYGERIQSGGDYRQGVGFRLFDVWVDGWWLNVDDVDDVAAKLGIQTVPCVQKAVSFPRLPDTAEALREYLPKSIVAAEDGRGRMAEGIVARTDPLLMMRDGRRVMWKLKFRDFEQGDRR